MKKVNVRFLKAGLVEMEVVEGLAQEVLVKSTQNALDEMTDKQLIDSMADCHYDRVTQSVFDGDSFQVEAIEDPEDNYKSLFQTEAWKSYQSEGLDKPTEIAATEDESINNGGPTQYYDLPKDVKDIQDVIELKKMDWNIANIFKACYRMGSQNHSSTERDLNKIIYFAKRQLEIEKKRKQMKLTVEELKEIFKDDRSMLELINKLNEKSISEEEEVVEDNYKTPTVPIVETINSIIAGALVEMDKNPRELSLAELLQLMQLKREWQLSLSDISNY